jgi:sugar phosphate isomerase/epimerase
MRPLALHQLTALDVNPLELVSLAAATGCQRIVTWVHDPVDPFPGKGWPQFHFPTVTPGTKAEMKLRLADNGIELANIEMFPIAPDVEVEQYRPYLEMGAELGAARAVVHVHDRNDDRAIQNLGRFCEIAAEYRIGAGIEFMGLIEACQTLERGLFFAKAIDRQNVGVALDFLHVTRTGSTPDDIAAIPARYISYAQICDGLNLAVTNDYLEEGLNRVPAGEGVWPLRALVEALPESVPIDVETPLTALKEQGVSALERARRAVEGARSIVENVAPWR